MNRIRDVPIPERMAHLDRDPRGYPIPFNVLRDENGRAHFTINSEETRLKILHSDLCSICGTVLFRGRWFVGGPLSAFHDMGMYNDPPMHHECATYVLRVCPYLAVPSYTGRIDDRTLPKDGGPTVLIESTMMPERPEIFVCAMALGQTIFRNGHIKPKRPFRRVEYWKFGERIPDKEGERIVAETLARELPEMEPMRFIVRGEKGRQQ